MLRLIRVPLEELFALRRLRRSRDGCHTTFHSIAEIGVPAAKWPKEERQMIGRMRKERIPVTETPMNILSGVEGDLVMVYLHYLPTLCGPTSPLVLY